MRNLPTLFHDIADEPVRFSDMLDRIFDRTSELQSSTFVPRVDVSETEKQFEVTAELPGMKKEDIDINMEGNVLTISGERRREQTEKSQNFRRVETSYGRFTRSLPFPDIINPDKIEAKYDNGLLHITIPKVKEKAGKKIKIS